MPVILWISAAATVYVACFKDDFTKENIDKALPFLIGVLVFALLIGIMLSWVGM